MLTPAVGIIRTMVAEMVPQKELQPRAFSIMPLVWTIGSIFGPSFGGMFAKPTENLPWLFGNSKFFAKFPFLLPNLVAAALFIVGLSTGLLFLAACSALSRPILANSSRKLSRRRNTKLIMVLFSGRSSSAPSKQSAAYIHNQNLFVVPQKVSMRPPPHSSVGERALSRPCLRISRYTCMRSMPASRAARETLPSQRASRLLT